MGTILDHILDRNDRGGRSGVPKVDIGSTHVLTDPERPSFAADREIGRSQFAYLRRSLDAAPPGQNDVWHALKDVAARVRLQQSPEASKPYVADIPDSAAGQTRLLLDVAIQSRGLRDNLSRDNDAPSAERLHKAVAAAAAEEGISGRTPSREDQAKVRGFAAAWNSTPGLALRGAYGALGESAQMYAARESQGAVEHNAEMERAAKAAGTTLHAADREAMVDPRATYKQWVAAVPAPVEARQARWTDSFAIGTDNPVTSKVMEAFVGLALKAHDRGKDPTHAEMRADVAKLDAAFAAPEKTPIFTTTITHVNERGQEVDLRRPLEAQGAPRQAREDDADPMSWKAQDGRAQRLLAEVFKASPKSATPILETFDTIGDAVRAGTQAREGGRKAREEIMATGVGKEALNAARNLAAAASDKPAFEAAAQAALAPRASVRGVAQHGIQEITTRPALTSDNPYAAHLVGIEGQGYYSNKAAIRKELEGAGPAADGRPKTFVTFAEPGTEFRKTLLEAAAEARIPVVHGSLRVSNHSVLVPSARTLEHVDYAYASANKGYSAEGLRVNTTNRALTVENPRSKDHRDANLAFDSYDGSRATRGALVVFDVRTPKETTDFIARLNNAALTSPEVILFGGPERQDNGPFKIARRRELSDMSQPRVIDKRGQELAPADVAIYTKSRGASVNDVRGVQNEEVVQKWETREPRTQALAARLLEKEPHKVAPLLDGFQTLGHALAAADHARAGGRKGREEVLGLGVTPEQLNAAASLRRAYAHAPSFNDAVKEAQGRTGAHASYAATQGMELLADPRDPVVRRSGPMVGFSSPSARGAAQGPRYAVIGDEKPLTPELQDQIGRFVETMAKLHGRNEAGQANFRLATTLTPGVGEGVMRAALEHGVPVEAYGSRDDRKFAQGSKEHELFQLAVDANKRGLGGTWSLAAYASPGPVAEPTREKAARAAIEGSDAIVASRIGRSDPLLMVVASAGQRKGLATLPAPGADPSEWSGTQELGRPGSSISAVIPLDERSSPSFVAAGARLSVKGDKGVTEARVETGAGALQLATNGDLRKLQEAAAGTADLTLGRRDPAAERRAAMAEHPSARTEVIDRADVDRFQDPAFRRSLGLTAPEASMLKAATAAAGVDRAMASAPQREETSALAARLSERFRVTTRSAGRSDGGMEA